MDRAEIIKELKQQITQSVYLSECSGNAGMRAIHRKKADFLFGLQREISALQSELEQVKVEMNSAGSALKKYSHCADCKFGEEEKQRCYHPTCKNQDKWQWRGMEATDGKSKTIA